MLRIRPYKTIDAQYIINWFENEEEFQKWSCNNFEYPLTEKAFNEWQADIDKREDMFTFTAIDEGGIPVGHFAIKEIDYDKGEMYFGFIVLDLTKRGKGYGKKMLTLAMDYAHNILKINNISIGVFTNNPGAIKCYEALGFKNNYIEEKALEYKGEYWDKLHMIHCLRDNL